MDVYQAIADENRRKLLDLLSSGEQSVQQLARHFDVTIGAVSQHLKVLLSSGLVTRRKEGRFRFYRAKPDALRDVHEWTARYSRFWDERLERLSRQLENSP